MTQPTTVTLTGTGVPHPSPGRAGAGALVRWGDTALQFDAGRGTVIRLAEAGVEPCALTAQFVTHAHSDHLVDLPDVAMTRWVQGQLRESGPLVVVAPEGTSARFARRMLEVFDDDIATRIDEVQPGPPEVDLRTFPAGETPVEVWRSEDGGVFVEAVRVHHEPVTDAVAYRVTTPTGVVVISGDTRVCDEVERLSVGADVLVHEACRSTALRELVAGTVLETIFGYHADTVPMGAMAERAGVPHLVLTHLIPAPEDAAGEEAFVDDVRRGGYTGAVTVGHDLTTVEIDRSGGTPSPSAGPASPTANETTLDLDRVTHLGIWRDEHDNITREFFDWTVPALPQACLDAIAAGTRADVEGIDLGNITDLLREGYLPLETGLAPGPRGGLTVAVHTEWPGTTPEMIDWWFGWHLSSTERYKLWHPQAHLFAQSRFELADAPGLPDRDRYIGNTSWVDEYIGPFPSRLAITFRDPNEFGLDHDALDAAGYGTVICATTVDSDNGSELASLVHAVRRTPEGCEMRSRFICSPSTPEFIGPPLLDHCWTEMTHLAGFLPRLHARLHETGHR
jgi:ribonuclease Z